MATKAEKHAEANRKFFDSLAPSYSSKPWQTRMHSQISSFLRDTAAVIGLQPLPHRKPTDGEVRLLDYACGTGFVSSALQPYTTTTTGIDISPAMVRQFNDRIPSPYGRAFVGDLVTPTTTTGTLTPDSDLFAGGRFWGFDIVATGAALHHFADPSLALARLAARLKPGGVLIVVDFTAGAGHGHARGCNGCQNRVSGNGIAQGQAVGRSDSDHHGHHAAPAEAETETETRFGKAAAETVHKHGFSREDMERLLAGAGLAGMRYEVMDGEVEMWFGERGVEDGEEGVGKRVCRELFVSAGWKV